MASKLVRVAVIGAGYTGLGTAIALAKRGNLVSCVDTDHRKIDLLSRGRSPIREPGFDREIAALTRRRRLRVSSETEAMVRESDVVFLCVGTPSRKDGSMDPSQVDAASRSVGEGLRRRPRQLVVVKSTVVPGTTESVVIPGLELKSGLRAGEFGVAVNPEFLREGNALQDSLRPSHIVIGEFDRSSGNALLRLYTGFRCPKLRTSVRVAEAVKYATNAFLATKVSFANEIANLCTRLQLDSDDVLMGVSMDPRVGLGHLVPGVGFGGSCLPKDIRALEQLGRGLEYDTPLLSAVISANDRQPMEAIRLLETEVGSLGGARIALLGLAFKAGTDDARGSKSLALARELVQRGASVAGYDPRAADAFSELAPFVEIAGSAVDALRGADGCVIQASWPEFGRLGTAEFGTMKRPVVIDGRRTWPTAKIPKGVRYRRIG